MERNFLLEGCIESKQEADYYKSKGISRLEICSHLELGGLCPDLDLVDYCINRLKIDSVIMLRLRGDFVFLDSDLPYLKEMIDNYKAVGANKFIFGFLMYDRVDIKSCEKILPLLDGCQCAFHMAIDQTADYERSIEEIINLGFDWVLTKGGNELPAIENIEILKHVNDTYGKEIKFLVGGKVTNDNWSEIAFLTGIDWFHGRKIA
ncbi:MAG: copper homeostasis protein CutC [Mycoplasma sp.]